MAVRETLDLDIRRALAQASQLSAELDKGLSGAAKEFESSISQATSRLGAASAGPIANIGAGLKAAGQDAAAAAQSMATLGPKADEAAAAMYAYQQSVLRAREEERLANQQRRETEQSLSRVGNSAGIAAAAIGAGLVVAINSAMDFNKQISMVGAVSGASAGQMAKLSEAAMQAGQATVFSAKQAAEAETELAKAGISTSDILNGALTGALNLAAAGQLDLARAAEISAQAMTTFGLRGSDVSHIADVLAAGANKSTGSVESLAQGLENVGGVAAKLFNISLEETVGTLALFDQNALRGAEGGTALRSALLSLATPTKQQAQLMSEIADQTGVQIDQFGSLQELAGNLQTAFAGMDDAQRRYALGVLFGSYGIRAANILYAEGADGVRKWTDSVNDAGAAQDFAGASMDNLAGDMEQLRGSIETALIGAGSQGNDVLRFMAQRATEAVNGIAQLPGPVQAAGFGMAGLATAGLGAVFVFGSLIPKWREVSDSLRNMGTAGTFAADNMGKIAKVGAGLAGAVTSFQMIGQSAEASTIGVLGLAASGAAIGSTFGPQGTAIGAAIGGVVGLGKAMLDSGESAEEFRRRMQGLASEIERLGTVASVKAFVDQLKGLDRIDFLSGGTNGVVAAIKQLRELAEISPASAQRVVEGLKQMRDEAGKPIFSGKELAGFEAAVDAGTAALERHNKKKLEADNINRQYSGSLDLTTGAQDDATKAWENYVAALQDGVPSVQSAFQSAIDATTDFAEKNKTAFDPQTFQQSLQDQLDAFRSWSDNVKWLAENGYKNLAENFAQAGPASSAAAQAMRDTSPEWRQAAEDTIGATKSDTQAYADWLATQGAALMGEGGLAAGHAAVTGVAGGITGLVGAATGAAEGVVGAVGTTWFGLPAKGGEAGGAGTSAFGTGITSKVDAATGAAKGVLDQAVAALHGDGPEGAGADFAGGFADGIRGSVWLVTAAASMVAQEAVAAARRWLQSQSPSRVMMQVGDDFGTGFSLGIDGAVDGAMESAANIASAAAGAAVDALSGDALLIARSAAFASGGTLPGSFGSSFAPPTPTPSSGLTLAQMAASIERMNANTALGINVNSQTGSSLYADTLKQGYVAPPVGVRSSWYWSQEMVDAYEAARPLQDRIAEAEKKLWFAGIASAQADIDAWVTGMSDATDDVKQAAADTADAAHKAVDDAKAALEAIKNGTAPDGTTPSTPTGDGSSTASADLAALNKTMEDMVAAERAVVDVLTKGLLHVEVTKMPDPVAPPPLVGTLTVEVNLPAGTPAETQAAAKTGAEQAMSAAMAEIRSLATTIKAL